MKDSIILIALVLMLALAACTPGAGTADTNTAGSNPAASAQVAADGDLSAQARLALGTLKLETTGPAVDETQAKALLPLWQALQALGDSDTTADAELQAVVHQIEKGMTADQISAINGMDLSSDTIAQMQESGELGFGGPGMESGTRGDNGATTAGGSGSAGGFVGGGGPGGLAGGPPPGGDFGGPGGFGPGGGNISEDQLATRQAEFANMDPAALQDRMLLMSVIRLMQTKTGEMPQRPGGGAFEAIFTAASEATGLSADEIQAKLAEGKTLAQVIEEAGGDVAAVRTAAVAAIQALPDASTLDAGQMVDGWLNQVMQPPPQPNAQATPAP